MPLLFKTGDCPVCAEAGAVLVLQRRGHDTLVLHCPSCGCAWPEPPHRMRLDEVRSLADVAPEGVELPGDEPVAHRLGSMVAIEAGKWLEFLEL